MTVTPAYDPDFRADALIAAAGAWLSSRGRVPVPLRPLIVVKESLPHAPYLPVSLGLAWDVLAQVDALWIAPRGRTASGLVLPATVSEIARRRGARCPASHGAG